MTNHILQHLVSVKYYVQASSAFCGEDNVKDEFAGYDFTSFSRVLPKHLFLEASFLGFR